MNWNSPDSPTQRQPVRRAGPIGFVAALIIAAIATVGCGPTSPGLDPLEDRDPRENVSDSRARYNRRRQDLVKADQALRFDAATSASLSDAEKKANARFTAARDSDLADFKASYPFPLSESFYTCRTAIEKSRIFGMVRNMPKGAALHVHSSSAGRAVTFVEACKRPECVVEMEEDGNGSRRLTGRIAFVQAGSAPPSNYEPSAAVRQRLGEESFAQQLIRQLTIGPEDVQAGGVWNKFGSIFAPVSAALNYEPVFDAYFLDAFHVLATDHVDYVELRTGLGQVVSSDDQATPIVDKYHALRERVRREIPGFDFKLIISVWRGLSNGSPDNTNKVRDALGQAMQLRAKFPDLVVGFDLVGQEDDGGTTYSFLNIWLDLPDLQKQYGVEMPFYFHDGESNSLADDNLFDAYLLRSRRIGHGLNLFLFPLLERQFAERHVALEVCPLSNQILGYVGDLRCHPASGYLERGVPVVISSDDPAVFGYEGLSYDYAIATLAWTLDLAALKQLALNSINYSAMSPTEKRQALGRWQAQWDAFIGDLLKAPTSNS